jgi:endonuclease/exonuclease/phosphatase (EEP) superfamily protein YafD
MRTILRIIYCALFLFMASTAIGPAFGGIFDLFPAAEWPIIVICAILVIANTRLVSNPTVPIMLLFSAITVFIFHNGRLSFQPVAPADHIRMLSLNVGQFRNDTNRVNKVISTIIEQDADIVLLQEFGLFYKWPNVDQMSKQFAKRVSMPFYHFQPHEGNIFGTAIFSRFPIQDSELIFNQLSNTNEAWIHNINCKGQEVTLVNFHLQSFNVQGDKHSVYAIPFLEITDSQLVQMNRVISKINQVRPKPTFVFGDLNCVGGSTVYNALSDQFIDAIVLAGKGWESTFEYLPIRIDHAFVSSGIVISNVDIIANVGSDHKAILLDVSGLSCLHSAVEN